MTCSIVPQQVLAHRVTGCRRTKRAFAVVIQPVVEEADAMFTANPRSEAMIRPSSLLGLDSLGPAAA